MWKFCPYKHKTEKNKKNNKKVLRYLQSTTKNTISVKLLKIILKIILIKSC
ncbi:unnamed protein product [Meloidogyne enterolobii]|uniref:Uncharacterized protein n=1 Tax=Meloidogyne enterolobii TaxID=390850 RepID=A0ACB0YLF4_MELEN